MRTLFTICFIAFLYSTNAQNFVWAKQFGGPAQDVGTSITTDASNNIYTIGTFSGSVDFDPGPGTYTLNSSGGADMFISKLDIDGNFIWAKNIGGNFALTGKSICIDNTGNIYITGNFQGTVDFDPGVSTYTLSASAGQDIFVLKLDQNGNFIWAKKMSGNNNEYATELTVDALSNVYITGYFQGTVDFDPGIGTYTLTVPLAGPDDIFISKLDANGDFVWAKQIGFVNSDQAHAIKIETTGYLYIAGFFKGTSVDFDPGPGTYTLTSGSSINSFILKLDINGDFIWAKQFEGSLSVINSIDLDINGNVITVGYFTNSVDFDPGVGTYSLNSSGGNDIFVSKIDANGNFIWAKQVGGGNNDNATSLNIDTSNDIYITGTFSGIVDFDPGVGTYTLSSVFSSNDPFILKLDDNGVFKWAGKIGAGGNENASDITTDLLGNAYIVGDFSGALVDFDPGSGTYSLNSAGNTDAFILKLDNALISNFNYSSPTCINSAITFTDQSSGIPTSWAWQFPGGTPASSTLQNPTVTYSTSGVHSVSLTVTNMSGSNTSTQTLTVNPSPTITVNSGTLCIGNTYTITASGADTYTWSTGATTSSIAVSPTVTSQYTVNGTSAAGCVSANGVSSTVTVVSPPTLTITGGGNFCAGDTKTLSATGSALGYTWQPGGATTSSIVVSPTTTIVYTLTATNGGNCTSVYTVQLTSNPNPILSVNASPSTICSGQSSKLTAAGATSYTWSTGATTNTTNVTPTITTVYSVIGKSVVGCTSTKTVAVNVNPSPTITVSSGTICAGESYTFNPTGAVSYTYSGGSSVVSPTSTTTYTISGSAANSCTSSVTSTVTVNSTPSITVNSGMLCEGSSYTITATGANTYTWSTGATTNSIVVSPTVTTSYSVIGTNTFGCISNSSAVAEVTVSPTPTITVASGSICAGASYTFNPTGAVTYTYSGGSSVVSPTSTTTYTIIGTDAYGCVSAAETSTVTVQAGASITITSNPSVACLGQSTTLTATGATSYTWSTGATTPTTTVTPISSTVYTVNGTYLGCISSQTVSITPVDIVLSTTVSNIACNVSINTGSISLLPSGGTFPYYYSWSNGATTANIKNLAVGNYSVIVSDAHGCKDSVEVSVTQPTSLTVNTSIINPACGLNDGQISSTVSGGSAPYTYIWSSGATTPVASSLTPGQYVLQVYDNNNCYGSAIVNLNPTNGPTITVGTTNSLTCYGDNNGSTSISVSGGVAPISIQWSNGSTASSISGLTAGVYDVLVTDASGCKVNESITINQPSGLSVQPLITRPNCMQSNGAIDIIVNGGQAPFSYTWSANAGGVNTEDISGIASGYYNVTIGYNGSCTQNFGFGVSDLTNLAVNVVTLTPSSCTSPTGMIDITAVNGTPAYTYSWSNGATTEDLSGVFPGNYFITVTDADQCKASTSIFLPSNIYDYQPEICLISVDTSNNTNYIVWQKNITYGVERYKIYRETSVPNNFQFVADVPFSALSEYTDLVANADIHSWRYRLSSVDSCGNEIPSNMDHKTIYLDVTFGPTQNILTWNYYAGWQTDTSKFYISRYDVVNGWQLYDSVAKNIYTFIDIAPPPSGTVKYLVEKKAPFNCIPQLKSAQTSNKTKSNVKDNNLIVTKLSEIFIANEYRIAPNPAKDELHILFKRPIGEQTHISIIDVVGKEVGDVIVKEGQEIVVSLQGYKPGVYFVRIQDKLQTTVKKFIKE